MGPAVVLEGSPTPAVPAAANVTNVTEPTVPTVPEVVPGVTAVAPNASTPAAVNVTTPPAAAAAPGVLTPEEQALVPQGKLTQPHGLALCFAAAASVFVSWPKMLVSWIVSGGWAFAKHLLAVLQACSQQRAASIP